MSIAVIAIGALTAAVITGEYADGQGEVATLDRLITNPASLTLLQWVAWLLVAILALVIAPLRFRLRWGGRCLLCGEPLPVGGSR